MNLDPDPAPLIRGPRRPAHADRWPPPRRMGDSPRRGIRDRCQLQAGRRELHGVLPLALGSPRAGPGPPVEAHYRWQGPGMYSGFCTTPIAQNSEQGGWGGSITPISGLDASDAVSAHSSGSSPTSRSTSCPITSSSCSRGRRAREGRICRPPYLLTHPESTANPDYEQAVDALADFRDAVNREDIDIVERVQPGLDSTPLSPEAVSATGSEDPCTVSRTWSADRMVGKRRVPQATPSRPRSVVRLERARALGRKGPAERWPDARPPKLRASAPEAGAPRRPAAPPRSRSASCRVVMR